MGILSDDIAIVNQILPHKNKWAWDLFLEGCANNWMPTEISMAKDIQQWKGDVISKDEKLLIKRCLGFFAGSESLVGNNLLITIFKYVCDGECRQYISRQNFEETVHNLTIVYICDSLGLKPNELYEAYKNIPSIKAKDDFLIRVTKNIKTVESVKNKKDFLRNLIVYYIICEGIFFYSGFAMLLNFGQQNKMPGLAEQIQYTLRDESLHIRFGITLINKIKDDYPDLWTEEFKEEIVHMIEEAMELEVNYAKDVLPNGILGMTSDLFLTYVKYIANRRLEQLSLNPLYDGVYNPFEWMSEAVDLPKLKNFFESRIIEYQVGNIIDDL